MHYVLKYHWWLVNSCVFKTKKIRIPEDLSKQQDQTHTTLDKLLYDLETMYDKATTDPESKPTAPAPGMIFPKRL